MLERIRSLFSYTGLRCLYTQRTRTSKTDRVRDFNHRCPSCICERFLTSLHSPGRVTDEEELSRFVFSPIHVGKKGNIKPAIFSHVFNAGCSIQRESIATESELVTFVKGFLAGDSSRSWHGVLVGDSKSLRDYLMENSDQRAFCIYDTAEKDNPAHGEIHQALYEISDADQIELRAKLFEVFNGGVPVSPTAYRRGTVFNRI